MAAPLLGAARAEPGERGAHVGRYPLPDWHADRFLSPGRGEGLHHQTIIADGALIERAFDLAVSICLARGNGLGEIRVRAAPAVDRGRFDIEEIGEVGFGQAVAAELAGLAGIAGVVGVGLRFGPGVRR